MSTETSSRTPAQVQAPVTPKTPRTPVAAAAAAPIAVLLAVAVVAAGAVLIRDALAAMDVITGSLWTTPLLTAIDGLTPQAWMVPAGAALALVGLWWLLAAFKPRKRSEVAIGASGVAWIRPSDLARIASSAASNCDGVVRVQARANRRKVRVTVATTAPDGAAIKQDVTHTVTQSLAALASAPSVKVRTRTIGVCE